MQKHKQQIEAYLKHHNYEMTFERKIMIAIIEKAEAFDFTHFKIEATRYDISRASIYNFKDLLVEAKILLPKEVTPFRFNDSDTDVNSLLVIDPKRVIANGTVSARVTKSHGT
jgi:Fe2+ or Zn2+ uptake regulation protein